MISFQSDKVVVPASNLNTGSILVFTPAKDGNGNLIYKVIANIKLPAEEITPTREAWKLWVNKGFPSVGTDASYMVDFEPENFKFNNLNLQAPFGGLSFSNPYCKIATSTPNESLYGNAFNDFLVYLASTGEYRLFFEGSGPFGDYHIYKKN